MASDDVRADARRLREWATSLADPHFCLSVPEEAKRVIRALLAELDRVTTDLDVYVGLHESMRATFTMLNEGGHLDDFAADELASDLDDSAFDENGREYRSRLDAAVAVIAHIREQAADVDHYGGYSGPAFARHILNIIGGEA